MRLPGLREGLVTEFGLGVLWFISGILILSIISEWFYSKAIKVSRGVDGLYGPCAAYRVWRLWDTEDEGYVFFLKLPSYDWLMDECNAR